LRFSQLLSAASALTFSRLILAALLPLLVYGSRGRESWLLVGGYLVALGTDVLDGVVARRTGRASGAGATFDAWADKALHVNLAWALVVAGRMPGWWMFCWFSREVLQAAMIPLLIHRWRVGVGRPSTSVWGRATAISLALCTLAVLFPPAAGEFAAHSVDAPLPAFHLEGWLHRAAETLTGLTALFGTVAGVDYARVHLFPALCAARLAATGLRAGSAPRLPLPTLSGFAAPSRGIMSLLFLLAGCPIPAPSDGSSTDWFPGDADQDGYTVEEGDCDDDDRSVHPGAEEVWYDGIDQNCDGLSDDDQDGDGFDVADDCDDTDAEVNPAAEEVCDGVDNNCDGVTDVGSEDAVTAYVDADADGWGSDDEEPITACDGEVPAGYAIVGGDCDDGEYTTAPDALELCDGVDNDCDGEVDEDAIDAPEQYRDADGDGFGDGSIWILACGDTEGYVDNADDCDDDDAATNPNADEYCDGVDNDCDGRIDARAVDEVDVYRDADGDGYGDPNDSDSDCPEEGWVTDNTDCDDTNPDVNPGAIEQCDLLDNDCDGTIDEDVVYVESFADADGDGYGDPAVSGGVDCVIPDGYVSNADDCNDAEPLAWSGATEVCDGVDNDCNGEIDDSPADGTLFYADADADGYGDDGDSLLACAAEGVYTASSGGDCDDSEPLAWTGASEVCDGVDNDCNGAADDNPVDGATFYADSDGDGYGSYTDFVIACEAAGIYTLTEAHDCDDTSGAVYEGAVEYDDGLDNDCDDLIDEDFVLEGDLVITEVARQPLMGTGAVVPGAQWVEVYNAGAHELELAAWTFTVTHASGEVHSVQLDPSTALTLAEGDYAVICATETWESAFDANSTLACDAWWGDAAESDSYVDAYTDNTLWLDADTDTLTISAATTTVDSISWDYDGVSDSWPRTEGVAMQVSSNAANSASNDDYSNWCDASATWYDDSAGVVEYGSPGAANEACP
jgi:phosphatidylglycerophosphate synthase